MKYSHVFWDWNGTLFDDADASIAAVNISLRKRNLPEVNLEIYKDLFGFPVSEFYEKIGFDFGRDSYEQLATEYGELYPSFASKASLTTGAKKVLEKLFIHSVRQYILSAGEKESLKGFLKQYKIDRYFTDVIASEDVYAAGKTATGQAWLADNPIDGRALMIGDTTHDLDVARALGFDCVLLTIGHNSLERIQKTGVPTVNSLDEISEIVLGKRTYCASNRLTPGEAERRAFDLGEAHAIHGGFAEQYRGIYNDVKNTTKTEDW